MIHECCISFGTTAVVGANAADTAHQVMHICPCCKCPLYSSEQVSTLPFVLFVVVFTCIDLKQFD